MSLQPTIAGVHFNGHTIGVELETDPFGGKEIIARFDAHRLHPFTVQASNPNLFDLLDFCVAFNALDRFTTRPDEGWSRRFVIRMPVSDPALWKRHSSLVNEWIYALTNDEVEVVPIVRNSGGAQHGRHPNLTLDDPVDVIGLVSDGLDSLCGVDAALQNRDRRYAWASVIAGTRGPKIRRIVDLSRAIAKQRLLHLTTDLKLKHGNKAREKTQRSRTVVAVVMGMAAAQAMSANTVECYENGIGLLNLPVPDIQFGAMSTQVLQPKHLPLWDRISSAFFGRTIELSFPNRFKTKSEMIRALSPEACNLLPQTFSCDAEARMKNGRVLHCGMCGSCRFRQLAIFDADCRNDATYAFIVREESKVDAGHLLRYHARLLGEALASTDPWRSLCLLQPELRGADASDDCRLRNRDYQSVSMHRALLQRLTVALISRHVDSVSKWKEQNRAA